MDGKLSTWWKGPLYAMLVSIILLSSNSKVSLADVADGLRRKLQTRLVANVVRVYLRLEGNVRDLTTRHRF